MKYYLCDTCTSESCESDFYSMNKHIIVCKFEYEEEDLNGELNGNINHITEFKTLYQPNKQNEFCISSDTITCVTDITNVITFCKANVCKDKYCFRCNTLLLKSELNGYKYVCAEHDEDLYGIESETIHYDELKSYERFVDLVAKIMKNANIEIKQ